MNAKIQAAKIDAVLDPNLVFFGSCLCNLKFVEDPTCDTAWTDGTTLGFNPAYTDTLSHAELIGLLAHETMHCTGAHPYRRDGREPKKWNVACDMAINPIITECGLKLPQGSLDIPDATWKGKSAEWLYDRLPDMPKDGGGQGPGEVRDSPSPNGQEDETNTEGQWEEIARQAAVQAKSQGKLPSGLDRFTKQVAQSKVDWKQVLRRFVQQNAKADYTWKRPSSRFVDSGMYMPSMHSEDMPAIAIAVDTSGSMDDIALAQAKAEVLSVCDEVNPSRIDVLYADAKVARHDSFERGEQVEFRPAGGGGTSFIPVFDSISKMSEQPCCVIYITDLCGSFPNASPDLPVLWITDTDLVAPFGETIKMA